MFYYEAMYAIKTQNTSDNGYVSPRIKVITMGYNASILAGSDPLEDLEKENGDW